MQTSLPLKWKLFRIANYLHLASVMIIFMVITYAFLSFGLSSNITDYLVYLLVLACAGVLITNSIMNHVLLERIYPDKMIPKNFSVASFIFLLLAMLLLGFLAFLFAFVLVWSFQRNNNINFWNKLTLLAGATIIITGFYCCIFQIVLKQTIRRNYNNSIDNFLHHE